MSGTMRERLLVMLLPAFVIVAVYGWFVLGGVNAERERVAAQLAEVSADPVAEPEIAAAQRELRAAVSQREALREELESKRAVLDRVTARFGSAGDPAAEIANLTNLLGRYGLRTIREGPETGSGMRVSEQLKRIERELGRTGGGRVLWSVDFAGTYAEVRAALEALPDRAPGLVPVALSMEEGDLTTPTRVWRLVVWV